MIFFCLGHLCHLSSMLFMMDGALGSTKISPWSPLGIRLLGYHEFIMMMKVIVMLVGIFLLVVAWTGR